MYACYVYQYFIFFPLNSVMSDFCGVMDRLVTSGRFDITFVFYKEQPIAHSAWDLRAVPKRADIKKVYDIGPWLEVKLRESCKSGRNNVKVLMYERSDGPVADWLGKPRREIGALRLDLFLYLDCTMTSAPGSRPSSVKAARAGETTSRS